MSHTVVSTSDDTKQGMTLGEVAAWVERCRKLGVPDDARVTVDTGFRGQIKQLSTT